MDLIELLFEPYYSYGAMDIFLEATAVFFGILSVWYARKENIAVYPTGLISTTIYVYVTFQAKLYADMGVNAYYTFMSIYGWYVWSRKITPDKYTPISRTNFTEKMVTVGIIVGSFAILRFGLSNYTDSDVPVIDAATTAIFLAAMYLMARKKIEHWNFWIVGNLISIPLYTYKGLVLTSIQFIVFLGLAISGYIKWRKILNSDTPAFAE